MFPCVWAALLAVLVMSSCGEKEEARVGELPAKSVRVPLHAEELNKLSEFGRIVWAEEGSVEREDLLTAVYALPDEDIGDLMDAIADEVDAKRRTELLAVVYEETVLRPDFVRLPLILEVARSADCDPGLRRTVLAELGAMLQTDHGWSWGDWTLALEEHLRETAGLIRE